MEIQRSGSKAGDSQYLTCEPAGSDSKHGNRLPRFVHYSVIQCTVHHRKNIHVGFGK